MSPTTIDGYDPYFEDAWLMLLPRTLIKHMSNKSNLQCRCLKKVALDNGGFRFKLVA